MKYTYSCIPCGKTFKKASKLHDHLIKKHSTKASRKKKKKLPVTAGLVIGESLKILKNSLKASRMADKRYKKRFNADHKIGDTIIVKTPRRFGC